MKECTRRFITAYISATEKGNISSNSIEAILLKKDNNCNELSELKTALLNINNDTVFDNLLRLEKDGTLYDYLKILMCFEEGKKELGYTLADVSYRAFTPKMTIIRFENLENLCSAIKLLKFLAVVKKRLYVGE